MHVIYAVLLVFISVTMLARANDLRRTCNNGWRCYARIGGLALAGSAPLGMILSDAFPFLFLFVLGVALVFLTTPGLPPWWKYISKGDES